MSWIAASFNGRGPPLTRGERIMGELIAPECVGKPYNINKKEGRRKEKKESSQQRGSAKETEIEKVEAQWWEEIKKISVHLL